MDIDSLYLLVSDAILRAETLADLGAPGASAAQLDVSFLEERIAATVPASNPEGALARRGAVRAAVAAGDLGRANSLWIRFSADPNVDSDMELELSHLLTPGEDVATLARREALAERFPWAERRYGMAHIGRLAGALVDQAEPLPIG